MNWRALRNAACLGLLLAFGPAVAENRTCQISPITGASLPQGAVSKMSVINNGQPCGLTLYGIPTESKNPATQGVITGKPKHGKAEFVGSRVQYTPEARYVGDDEFSCEARAIGANGRSHRLKVQMKVQVRAKE